MPFIRITDGFIWKFRLGEDVDLRIISNAQRLCITLQYPNLDCPLAGPLREVFARNAVLEDLELWDVDLTDMPEIPDSVRSLTLRNTTITNLNQIRSKRNTLVTLILDTNTKLTGNVNVPEGVEEFAMVNQQVEVIRFPPGTKTVHFGPLARFTQLTGSLPSSELYCVHVFTHPYKNGLIEMDKRCKNEISNSLPMYEDLVIQEWHKKKMRYIEEVNKQIGYTAYANMGSIPKRIRVSPDNIENPIVVAMNLVSNYPRRMAEFVCY